MTLRGLALACGLMGVVLAPTVLMPSAKAAVDHADGALMKAVDSPSRSRTNVARDPYRHPAEVLRFFGLKPGMKVLEIWPGGEYWTEILAPYAKATGGKYIAALPRPARGLPSRFADKAKYGDIEIVAFNDKSGPLVAPGSVDMVLTFRNVHNWLWTHGMAQKAFRDFYAALKPGGVLGVVEHRADPRPMVKDAHDGYVSTALVVKLAKEAGFQLAASSEINANPKDTKNYPFGVWTLPPTLQSAPDGKPANSKFDSAKYRAIGESDRMTLRFVKPM